MALANRAAVDLNPLVGREVNLTFYLGLGCKANRETAGERLQGQLVPFVGKARSDRGRIAVGLKKRLYLLISRSGRLVFDRQRGAISLR